MSSLLSVKLCRVDAARLHESDHVKSHLAGRVSIIGGDRACKPCKAGRFAARCTWWRGEVTGASLNIIGGAGKCIHRAGGKAGLVRASVTRRTLGGRRWEGDLLVKMKAARNACHRPKSARMLRPSADTCPAPASCAQRRKGGCGSSNGNTARAPSPASPAARAPRVSSRPSCREQDRARREPLEHRRACIADEQQAGPVEPRVFTLRQPAQRLEEAWMNAAFNVGVAQANRLWPGCMRDRSSMILWLARMALSTSSGR
jgi:hypothetical protein